MIGSSHQIPELIDHSCNESSVMITMLSRAGPAGSGHRRSAGQRTSERNRHVQVTQHIPDRARHPGRDYRDHRAGLALGHLLLGLVDLAAGVIALAWPGPTALVLVLIVGVWAITAGLVEFSAAFASGEPAGTRVMFILGGLVTVAFGVVLCARPGLGAITLALLFGLFNLTAGTWMLVQGIELRRTGKTQQPAHTP